MVVKKNNPSVKVWHLIKFYGRHSNKNGRQDRLKIEKLSFWTKFKALGDRFLKNEISAQLNTTNNLLIC